MLAWFMWMACALVIVGTKFEHRVPNFRTSCIAELGLLYKRVQANFISVSSNSVPVADKTFMLTA